MKTPPFILAAALVFWGWQSGFLIVAIAMAGALEFSRWSPVRMDLDEDGYKRIWNLCAILFVGAALYVFFAREGPEAIGQFFQTQSLGVRSQSLRKVSVTALTFIQFLPMVFLPMALAQAYGRAEKIKLRVFSILVRAHEKKEKAFQGRPRTMRSANITYPYLLVVMMGTSATDSHEALFYPILAVLVVAILWWHRSRGFSRIAWSAMAAAVVLVGFGAQAGLVLMQKKLQELETRFLNQFGQTEFNAAESRTAMGTIGDLKLSGKIVLRLESGTNPPPELLREASFNQYQNNTWGARNRDFNSILVKGEPPTWFVNDQAQPQHSATIYKYISQGHDLLPLPERIARIRGFGPDTNLETNRYGSAVTYGAPSLAEYQVDYGGRPSGFDGEPVADDLAFQGLDSTELLAVQSTVESLDLDGLSNRDKLNRIRDHFLRHFEYSTYQSAQQLETTNSPLAAFLSEHRRGHCEYFASATTLLLRTAGIPSRYAVGFSVQERKGERFIVRHRHAHAWSLAYLDGQWTAVDNTPASWTDIESANAGRFESVYDFFSNLWFQWNTWRMNAGQARIYIFTAGLVILAFLAWRQVRGHRWRRSRKQSVQAAHESEWPGQASSLYPVLELLNRQLTPRPQGEPLRRWISRLSLPENLAVSLDELVIQHYRLRFDPNAASSPSAKDFSAQCGQWMESYQSLQSR